jgi:hypothetical protein
MSSVIVLCLSSHYRIMLLLHYELVPSPASVGYVQTISNNVARASSRLVPPQSLAYVIIPVRVLGSIVRWASSCVR